VAGAGAHRWQEVFRELLPEKGCGGEKNAPRGLILGGGDTGAGRRLDTKGESYPAEVQNSIAVAGAIFSLISNVNKDQFMTLLLQALFSYY